jgi:hypothetical protein
VTSPLLETALDGLPLVRRGKVRDLYACDEALIIVATDRISAFDYVLGSGIPDKGRVLTQLSAFWFDRTRHIVDNHVLGIDAHRFPTLAARRAGRLLSRSSAWRADICRGLDGKTIEPPVRFAESRCRPDWSSRIVYPSRYSRLRPRPTAGTI